MTDPKPFNALDPATAELLALLAEECGELVQAIGKVLRHGLDSQHPDSGVDNQDTLEREMGDVRAAMILLCEAGIASRPLVHEHACNKLAKVGRYLHHSRVPELPPS